MLGNYCPRNLHFLLPGGNNQVGYHIIQNVAALARFCSTKKTPKNVTSQNGRKSDAAQTRWNPLHIQMLSSGLHRDIFRGKQKTDEDEGSFQAKVERSKKHLKEHELIGKTVKPIADVSLKLPRLYGKNIDDHFRVLARTQSEDHRVLARTIAESPLPPMPKEWTYSRGWTAYHEDGSTEAVDFPPDQALVFDIECCVTEGNYPTLAVAASPSTWYSWCSERLVEGRLAVTQRIGLGELIPLESPPTKKPTRKDLLPRLVVGHNVSYDRSFVKEQYYIQKTKLRFLDTLSLHMCVSGLTTYQRTLWMGQGNGAKEAKRTHWRNKSREDNGSQIHSWQSESSPNNLVDVYNCHVKNGTPLDKSKRDTFITGTMEDIRQDFQQLMTYCAKDVTATHEVFQVLLDDFFERFEHPVTFAAMMEMGQCYLPVNRNWDRYLQDAQETYDNLQNEMKILLMQIANENCQYLHNNMYKDDPWLWDLDWSVEKFRLVKKYYDSINGPPKKRRKRREQANETGTEESVGDDGTVGAPTDPPIIEWNKDERTHSMGTDGTETMVTRLHPAGTDGTEARVTRLPPAGTDDTEAMVTGPHPAETDGTERMLRGPDEEDEEEIEAERKFQEMRARFEATQSFLPKRAQHMVGYPVWYRDLCPRHKPESGPGPTMISSQTRVTPKLLRMTWEGYPLHYIKGLGWGYLVPKEIDGDLPDSVEDAGASSETEMLNDENNEGGDEDSSAQEIEELQNPAEPVFPIRSLLTLLKSRERSKGSDAKVKPASGEDAVSKPVGNHGPSRHGRYPSDVDDGGDANVGNPLAKDFLNKLEDGTLSTEGGLEADKILEINKVISYWRNASKRISSQMVVSLNRSDLPTHVTRSSGYEEEGMYGAILPKVITAGTVTRRAVEPTWLTATNALPNRVGSELKGMVQAPPGYHFVGADVDSQELWIAAILGDSNFVGIHGCTAFGWMTLQGNKKDATDMHSMTANTVGISRDHAKVINYARIYGAGKRFARHLLMQFNHSLSSEEAWEKAGDIFSTTKGEVMYRLLPAGEDLCQLLQIEEDVEEGWISAKELNQIPAKLKKVYSSTSDDSVKARAIVPPSNGLNSGRLVNVLTDKQAWFNGSESYMFNKLEDIAMSKEPRTPVLGCRISRALEPDAVNNEFLTSRVNWVVQSSAVDYLHLLLVATKWIFDLYKINGRFAISIHDEVRYLVKSEDRYRAALALQIANLLTRSMFAFKLGMNDLPQSVAFFSAIDIDTVLRKESEMECVTPSNPHGLEKGYGIPQGEALNIHELMDHINGGNTELPRKVSAGPME